jgi:hypothetical protein
MQELKKGTKVIFQRRVGLTEKLEGVVVDSIKKNRRRNWLPNYYFYIVELENGTRVKIEESNVLDIIKER